MIIKIKKLDLKAIIPFYAKQGDAGLDLTAISIKFAGNYIEYGTGLAIEIPEGYVGLLFPRSSISKYSLSLANSVGVIDSSYRGEIKFRFKRLLNLDSFTTYNVGDKIGQIIILPIPKIELIEGELSETERGSGGFGHTDLKK